MKLLCSLGLLLLAHSAGAQQHSSPSTRPAKGSAEYKEPTSAGSPAANAVSPSQRTDATQPSLAMTPQKVKAGLMLYWNLSRGKLPDAAVLRDAGYRKQDVRRYFAGIKKNDRLTDAEIEFLRTPYDKSSNQADERLVIREKIINYMARYQEVFKDFQDTIPELLTVWGEARNLSGLSAEADRAHLAQVASIVHVIRNRTRRMRGDLESSVPGIKPHQVKRTVVTRRYQFSAWEYFDPNLAELGTGPVSTKIGPLQITDLNAMQQRSIDNIALALTLMQENKLLLSMPLAGPTVFHYITPELADFNAQSERAFVKKSLAEGKTALRLPTTNPRFLAIAPQWATQTSVIVEPDVLFVDKENAAPEKVQIPPKNFIYFDGIL